MASKTRRLTDENEKVDSSKDEYLKEDSRENEWGIEGEEKHERKEMRQEDQEWSFTETTRGETREGELS